MRRAIPYMIPHKARWLLLAGCLGAGFSSTGARADAGSIGHTATRLLELSADASDAGTRVSLHTDGAPGKVAVFMLQDPPRLVIDFLELREAETPARVPVGGRQVSQLRVGRHPERIRVVADAGPEPASLDQVVTETRPDGLVVKIGFPRGDGPPERFLALPSAPAAGASKRAAAPVSLAAQADAEARGATPGDVRVELQADRRRIGGSVPRGMSASRSSTRELDLDSRSLPSGRSEGAAGGGPFDRGFASAWLHDGEGFDGLTDWVPGTLADDRVRLGLFDDRIRFTTRYARSLYDASRFHPAAPGGVRGRDLDLFLAPAGVVGEAFSGRLEGTLWRSAPARIDAFASYQRVDPLFAWSESGKKDPFSKSNRRMLEAGGVVRSGPFGLALSRISEQPDVDDFRTDRPRRWSNKAVVSASLDPLRHLDAGASEHPLWSLAPDSAWVSMSQGGAEPNGPQGEGASTRDLSAGLSWKGASSSATLGLWRSSYEGETALDWSGSGADLDYGIYRERWSLYAGLGAQRYLTDQPGYRSLESNLAGYVSFSVRPENLPGLATTLYLSRYQWDEGDSGSPLQTDGLGFRMGLDLAPYLLPDRRGSRTHLRASYGALWSRTHGDLADEHLALDHGPSVDFGIDF